ncbi:MAG: diguanylate cyclase domain-containing protein, partial [Gemmatimonadota bacterium]
ERMRQAVKAHYFEALQGKTLTISCGVACMPFSSDAFIEPRHQQDALIAWADRALYTAKRGGRDRSITAEARSSEE